jgi:hypothetical protein
MELVLQEKQLIEWQINRENVKNASDRKFQMVTDRFKDIQ